jgi:hypothetical protein
MKDYAPYKENKEFLQQRGVHFGREIEYLSRSMLIRYESFHNMISSSLLENDNAFLIKNVTNFTYMVLSIFFKYNNIGLFSHQVIDE